MDAVQLALLELFVGVVIGGGVAALVVVSVQARRRMRVQASSATPDGVRDVLRAMDDAAAVVDVSGTVRAASAAASGFGLHEGDVLAEEQVRGLVRSARDLGSATELLTLRRTDVPSEQRTVAARAATISPRLTLVVLRDITERERVERMRRDFVANTSHELKTPVGAISLLAEAIESAADDPEQVRVFAARMSAEATRLAELTARVMDLSRLQAADTTNRMRVVSVDAVIGEVLDAHHTAAAAAAVTLVRGGKRGRYVLGDPAVLVDAVGNLVANAIAYSPAGAQVGIGVKKVHDRVEIAVTDHGVGIPETEQTRIFERFYRADQARSRHTGGTGLGLSIVKHAVQLHGGEVRVWSRPGHGSTFTIALPLTDPPLGADAKPKKPKKSAKTTKAEKTGASAPEPREETGATA